MMLKNVWTTTIVALAIAGCGGSGGGGDDVGDDGGPVCGDGTCDPGETPTSCADDCHAPRCGDGTCDPGETAASCAADCPSTCGNGTCDPSEDAASCPTDCDPTACTVAPDTCTGEDLCISGHCVSAFGRNYVISIGSGMFPEDDANGDTWDIGGGLPDPTVTITVNGAAESTPVIDDTLAPTWDYVTAPTLIPGGTVFQIDVYDSDLTADDLAWSCLADPLTADFIRGGLRCAGTGELSTGYVDLTFTPN